VAVESLSNRRRQGEDEIFLVKNAKKNITAKKKEKAVPKRSRLGTHDCEV
jgi:hypothetical protein